MSTTVEATRAAQDPLLRLTEAVGLRPDQRLTLDDPRILWLVTRGSVDLFAVELVDGAPLGRWHFLCRLTEGTATMGFAGGPRHAVLGRPAPGAVVSRCTLATVKHLTALASGGPDVPTDEASTALELLAKALETTLIDLASTMSVGQPPREFQPLDVAQELTVAAESTVRSAQGLVWAEVQEGQLTFRSTVPTDLRRRGELFPLTRSDWCSSTGPARLVGHSTLALLREDRLWPHLLLHLMRQMYSFDRRLEDRLRAEMLALVTGAAYDRKVGQRATVGLAAVLGSERSRLRVVDVARDDPALAATRLVGERLGVEVVAPLAGAWFDPKTDPVDRIATASGLLSRKVRLEGRWWRGDNGPLVGRVAETGRAVALLPDRRGYALIDIDPDRADGVDRLSTVQATMVDAEVAGTLVPEARALYRRLDSGVAGPRRLLAFGARGCGRDLVRLCLALVAAAAAGLIIPVMTGVVLGDLVPRGERGLIVQACLLVLALAVVTGAATLMQHLALLRLEGRLDNQLQSAVWGRLLSMPVSFFSRWSTGELSTAAMGVSAIREALGGVVVTAAIAGVVGLANLVLLLFYDPLLALVALVLFAVGSGVSLVVGLRQVRAQRELVMLDQRLSARAFQLLGGVSKIRVSAAQSRAYAHWAALFGPSRAMVLRTRRMQNVLTTFTACYVTVCSATLFALVAGPFAGRLSTAAFLSFFVAFSQLLSSSVQATGAAIGVLGIVPMFENLRPVLDGVPEQQSGAHDPGELVGGIELSHVSFAYEPDGPLVLDDVDLRIEPGEFIAVVGPTGCGKSTLLRALLGFVDPHSGAILFDDQDLSELDVTAVRRQCGVVLQSGSVFAGDLLTNVVGSSSHSADDAWEAIRMAGLEPDVREMPMQLHTVLADGGGTLSAGQRQRLMVARALVGRPRMLFFDEATSALDNPTQQIVAESTRLLRATRLVIAHRLSTVVDADRIVVMEQGRIVQVGTYTDLLAETAGLFAELAARQLA